MNSLWYLGVYRLFGKMWLILRNHNTVYMNVMETRQEKETFSLKVITFSGGSGGAPGSGQYIRTWSAQRSPTEGFSVYGEYSSSNWWDLPHGGEGRAFQSKGTKVSLIKTFKWWSSVLSMRFRVLTLTSLTLSPCWAVWLLDRCQSQNGHRSVRRSIQ